MACLELLPQDEDGLKIPPVLRHSLDRFLDPLLDAALPRLLGRRLPHQVAEKDRTGLVQLCLARAEGSRAGG